MSPSFISQLCPEVRPRVQSRSALNCLEKHHCSGWRNGGTGKKEPCVGGRVQGGSHMRELAGEGDSLSLGWNSHEYRVTLRYTNVRHSTDFLRAELRFKPFKIRKLSFSLLANELCLVSLIPKRTCSSSQRQTQLKKGKEEKKLGQRENKARK